MHAIRLERSPSSNDTSCLSATLDFSFGRMQTRVDWTRSMTSVDAALKLTIKMQLFNMQWGRRL